MYGYSNYHRKKRGFDFGDFEITKREILASISIIAIMLLIGVLISGRISERQMDKNEIYNKAVKIEDQSMFEYGMRTNIGNAFVYGDLKAVDTVTYPEIGGKYMYVEKVEEHYNRHTRTVTTTVNGKTRTRTEVYYSWDWAGSEDKTCKEISFLGVTLKSNKINIPESDYIDMIKESSRVRYKYYGTKTKHTGTIFTELKDETITDDTAFYKDRNITETLEMLESGSKLVGFWIFWIILIIACVYGFYYIDNEWLE